jgi:hypothetical protein
VQRRLSKSGSSVEATETHARWSRRSYLPRFSSRLPLVLLGARPFRRELTLPRCLTILYQPWPFAFLG